MFSRFFCNIYDYERKLLAAFLNYSKRSPVLFAAFIFLLVSASVGLTYGILISLPSASPKTLDAENRNAFGIQKSYSKHYFVSGTGNDNSNGTTIKSPFLTIDKAISFAQGGDIIYLADGDYYQTISSVKSGTKDSPIVIRGSRKAIIRGVKTAARIIEIKHSFMVLDGFTVDGMDGSGTSKEDFRLKLIYVIGAESKKGVEGLKINNMLVQNSGGECIRLRYFARNNEISNSTIKNCGIHDFKFPSRKKNGEGIYIGTAPEQRSDGKNPTADIDESNNNYIYGNSIETHGNECVDIKEGSSDNLVENNVCQFQSDPESGGFDARGSGNTFRYNTSKNNIGAGIRLGGDTKTDGINNNVYGNLLTDNRGVAIKMVRSPQGKICGNTVLNNDTTGESKPVDKSITEICSN